MRGMNAPHATSKEKRNHMVDAHDDEVYSATNSRLIWIDCEMTGLDIFHDELCEISVVPTDFELNVLDEGIDFVIKPSDAAVAHMNDFVRAMHTRSGLIDEWADGLDVAEAERRVIEYVKQFTPEGVKPLLAGNSVGSDKNYRNRPAKNGGHRALADIIESLDELRYYRAAVMAPEPGPGDVEAKEIAKAVEQSSILNK